MKKIILSALFMLVTSIGYAGWVMEEVCDGDKQLVYIGNGKIKVIQEDSVTIFDIKNERITLIATLLNSYWEGGIEELKKETGKNIDDDIKKLSKENKKEYEELMKNSLKDIKDIKSDIKVNKTNEIVKISGYETQKYEILVNGKLKEEVWIAKDITISKKNDLAGLKKIGSIMGEFSYENEFKYNVEIIDLMKEGYPMKISAILPYEDNNGKFVSEIVRADERKLDENDFKIPPGFKKVKLSDIW